MEKHGLFIGLTTVDIQYRLDAFPASNTKVNAGEFQISAGGPATNAAVAFAALNGKSTLVSRIGSHALTEFVLEELTSYSVEHLDTGLGSQNILTISSILTIGRTGERTIITTPPDNVVNANSFKIDLSEQAPDIVLVDGFNMDTALPLAQSAQQLGIPMVFDGGSWKDGTDSLLEYVTIAICSEDFCPPGVAPPADPRTVIDYLRARNVPLCAVTRGEKPIVFFMGHDYGEIPIATADVVDTLGAGDIFHGAFCCFYADHHNFSRALTKAAHIATASCQYFGTRAWINALETPF